MCVPVNRPHLTRSGVQSNLGGGEGLEGIYGTLTRHYMQLVLESLSAHCGLVASSSLIDVGSGLGRLESICHADLAVPNAARSEHQLVYI